MRQKILTRGRPGEGSRDLSRATGWRGEEECSTERRSIDRSVPRKRKVSRLWVVAWLLAAGFWGTVVRAQMCGDFFMSANSPTELLEVNTSTNPFTVNTLGTASVGHNAMAYDQRTDTLYAIAFPSEHLLQISSDGTETDLGPVAGLPPAAPAALWDRGAFAADGFMYVAKEIFDTLYRIDVDTIPPTATPVSLSQPVDVFEFAEFDGLFYGVSTTSGDLISIDPNTGGVTTIGPTGFTTVRPVSASNGVFGIGLGTPGFFCFDPATGAATLIADFPGISQNHAARCLDAPLQFDVDLVVTKDDGSDTYTPGTDVVYEIVVTNDGLFGVCGATVSDPLPDGITTASWTCTGADDGVCGADSGSGEIVDTPSLPVGGSVTYTYTVSVPADYTGDLVNTVTAELPEGFSDTMPDDNTATDIDVNGSPGEPGIEIEKSGSGPDPLTVGSTIDYEFLVTNTGDVTLTNVTVTDPLPDLSPISCPDTTLAPGAEMTCTATYEVTQADVDAGVVENTATATGETPTGGPPPTDESTTTVPPTPPVPSLPSLAFVLLVALLATTAFWTLRRRARA